MPDAADISDTAQKLTHLQSSCVGCDMFQIDTPIMQLVAYSSLTLSSLIVALAALIVTYRQNFGWKPLILGISHGLMKTPEFPGHYIATASFEVWNRRKYPLVVRSVNVKFKWFEVVPDMKGFDYASGWQRFNSDSFMHEGFSLGSLEHRAFDFRIPFEECHLDGIDGRIIIEAWIFDPRASSTKLLKSEILYNFSYGWRM